jgi:hypothetical protein
MSSLTFHISTCPSSSSLLARVLVTALAALVALGLVHALVRAACVEHVASLLHGARLLVGLGSALAKGTRLELTLDSDGPVAAEALSHIDHAPFALGIALLQLLALGRECVFERRAEAVAGGVAVDLGSPSVVCGGGVRVQVRGKYHDAVGVLEAEGQGSADVFARLRHVGWFI